MSDEMIIRADEGADPHAARAAEIEATLRGADTKKTADAETSGKLDKILSGLGDMGTKVDTLSKRLDALEARKPAANGLAADDDDDDLIPPAAGGTAMTAADAARRRDAKIAKVQHRADAVANMFGERAEHAMSGETVRAYRIRLLRRFQPYAKDKNLAAADLGAIADSRALAGIESQIFADARAEALKPTDIPAGVLRAVKRTNDAGHVEITWFGDGPTWMAAYAGPRQAATGDWAHKRARA